MRIAQICPFISERHFVVNENIDAVKKLFKHTVGLVEIEVFSYCNRACWFCPNREYSRRDKNNFLSEKVYLSIIHDLASVNYSEMISFSRYNEPLADPIIFNRLEQARAILPNAFLHFNTNGDYLNRTVLEKLLISGLNGINIQVYQGKQFSEEYARKAIVRIGKNLKIKLEETSSAGDWIESRSELKTLKIRVYSRNFKVNGVDRGGTVLARSHERTSPCFMPIRQVYVDYNGCIMPCCNLRSDIPKHKDFILGALNGSNSLFSVYGSKNAVRWRKELIAYGKKKYPCRSCNYIEHESTEENRACIRPFLKYGK